MIRCNYLARGHPQRYLCLVHSGCFLQLSTRAVLLKRPKWRDQATYVLESLEEWGRSAVTLLHLICIPSSVKRFVTNCFWPCNRSYFEEICWANRSLMTIQRQSSTTNSPLPRLRPMASRAVTYVWKFPRPRNDTLSGCCVLSSH